MPDPDVEQAKLRLTRRRFQRLKNRLEAIEGSAVGKETAYSFYHEGRGFALGREAYAQFRSVADEVRVARAEWTKAYPASEFETRLSKALVGAPNVEAALAWFVAALDGEIADYIAVVPFFGLHLAPGVSIPFGSSELRTLGENALQELIGGRLRMHLAGRPEHEIRAEIARVSELLKIIANVPTIRFEQRCGQRGVVPALAPCADRVAEFLQFCVALRGRRYERNIVDFRGQYQGRFATFIPVMTAEYDVFDLPNVRGSVATHTFDAGDLSELARLGILRLAPFALQPPKRRDSIDAMLWRSIGMVADGERSVNPRQALTAYVSACEALFSKQDEAQRITCAGMAASVATDLDAVSHALSLAKEVYQARSDTVHLGMDAAYVVQARNFALASVLNIAGRTSMIRTRSDVRAWVLGNLSRLERREH